MKKTFGIEAGAPDVGFDRTLVRFVSTMSLFPSPDFRAAAGIRAFRMIALAIIRAPFDHDIDSEDHAPHQPRPQAVSRLMRRRALAHAA